MFYGMRPWSEKPVKVGNIELIEESAVFQQAQMYALGTISCVSSSSSIGYVSTSSTLLLPEQKNLNVGVWVLHPENSFCIRHTFPHHRHETNMPRVIATWQPHRNQYILVNYDPKFFYSRDLKVPEGIKIQ